MGFIKGHSTISQFDMELTNFKEKRTFDQKNIKGNNLNPFPFYVIYRLTYFPSKENEYSIK